MDHRQKLLTCINRFYVEGIEEFREAEARIANDSKFRTLFRKKDYAGNIEMLKKCRKAVTDIEFPEAEIPRDDGESMEMLHKGQESVRTFIRLCDSYIRMQTALDGKARGEELSLKEYNEIYGQAKKIHAEMNQAMRELDVLYADFSAQTEPEGEDTEGYVTYDMLVGGDGKP